MEDNTLSQSLKTALEEVKKYVDLQISLNKAVFGKKAEEFSSNLLLTLIVTGLALFVLLLSTFGFVYWYGTRYGSLSDGFFIAAGFYLLVVVLVLLFKNRLINKPLRKTINKSVSEGMSDLPATVLPQDEDFADKLILQLHEKIVKQEEVLKKSFGTLESELNAENLIRQLFTHAYRSVVTTTNIAKAVYYLTSRLKRRKQQKKEQKEQKRLEQ